MKSNPEMARRNFLKQTSAAAALSGLLASLDESTAHGAETTANSKQRAAVQAVENVLNEIETKTPDFLSVARKDGEFLSLLIKVARAKNVLEIGTSRGYATIWISRALQETGGKLTTIEVVPERVQLAKTHIAKAGLSDRVKFLQGDAHQIVTTLKGPFDFVFLDADKDREHDYFEKLFPRKVAAGAIFAAHNAIKSRDMMKPYLDRVSQHPELDTVIVSLTMDDGFAVSYRRRR